MKYSKISAIINTFSCTIQKASKTWKPETSKRSDWELAHNCDFNFSTQPIVDNNMQVKVLPFKAVIINSPNVVMLKYS